MHSITKTLDGQRHDRLEVCPSAGFAYTSYVGSSGVAVVIRHRPRRRLGPSGLAPRLSRRTRNIKLAPVDASRVCDQLTATPHRSATPAVYETKWFQPTAPTLYATRRLSYASSSPRTPRPPTFPPRCRGTSRRCLAPQRPSQRSVVRWLSISLDLNVIVDSSSRCTPPARITSRQVARALSRNGTRHVPLVRNVSSQDGHWLSVWLGSSRRNRRVIYKPGRRLFAAAGV